MLVIGLVRIHLHRLVPAAVMPFAALSGETRARILRRKTRLRGLALVLFVLAALTMVGALSRGFTLALAVAGFFCQYLVFRLKRLYPVLQGEVPPFRRTDTYNHAPQHLARR
jgi:hypothetical protein